MSIPAKAFSEPVRTMAPTCSSFSNSLRQVFNSEINSSHRALSYFGLLRVIVATLFLVETKSVL